MQSLVAATRNSVRGLAFAFGSERAVRQEVAALAICIPAALFITAEFWLRVALVASVLFTLTIELLNTCFERLCDHLMPERHPEVKAVKDVASAAVFCSLILTGL